jgi:hypothetical protein
MKFKLNENYFSPNVISHGVRICDYEKKEIQSG